MPADRPAQPPDAALARVARRPSTFAPRTAADPGRVGDFDLSDPVYAAGRLTGGCLSGRAFVTAGAGLTRVRLVAVTPFLSDLAGCPHLAAVTHLDLTGCRAGPAGLATLLASPHLAGLQSLDLAGNALGAAGAAALARWPGVKTLSCLGLAANDLTADDVTAVVTAAAALRGLDASANPLGPPGWAVVAGRPWRRLAAAHCGLGVPPRDPAPGPGVWNLAFNAVRDAGVRTLAEAGAFAPTRELTLAGNRLTAAGLAALAGACPVLETLDATANFLPPADLVPLLGAAGFPALRRLAGGVPSPPAPPD